MIEKFLADITPEWTTYELTKILDKWVKVITLEEAVSNKTKNIYALWGVSKDLVYEQGTRAKDIDIAQKNYFLIDLDIHKNYKELFNEECTGEFIKEQALMLSKSLEDIDPLFSEWSYIVFTGGGLHIYYIGNSLTIDKEDYANAVEYIYQKWDSFWDTKVFYSDHACKNIARISRLPWTVNQKYNRTTEILFHKESNSRLFNYIPAFAKKVKEKKQKEAEIKKRQLEESIKERWLDDNPLYDLINSSIPAWQIAQVLVPMFPFDGKKNFFNEKWWYTWYFYVEDTNTICNWGSQYFSWGTVNSCWNNFQLIKREKNFTNKETFNFFKKLLNIHD